MEARMPFRADRMQDLALGLSGRPRQALPSKIRTRVRVRTLLPHSAAFVARPRIARRLGITRIWQTQDQRCAPLRTQAPHPDWLPPRNESPAGQLAPRGDSRRAPDHHRIFEMEKPYAGLQRRRLARRNHAARAGTELLSSAFN